ncbi:hypothetical protein FVR03_01405 [Pontibacter qinzhouensis]|uniref:Right-handed parallel beta-helix repeat-containing protein n=1 Tax=Pontibacter qinzhouensis TaxID=2603253 RepID=A0A5C8KDV6_9BACT|nr:hypothetical protein [Pontibacter qinzhouensis]TXK52401.1 hypothetical protein FVR03_01405 [Pontibacter qinzhouensis]
MSELAQKISAHFKAKQEIAEMVITMLSENQQLKETLAQRDKSLKTATDALAKANSTITALQAEIAELKKPVVPVVPPVVPKPPIIGKINVGAIIAERGMVVKDSIVTNPFGSAAELRTNELVRFENCDLVFTEHGLKNHNGNIFSNYELHNCRGISLGPMDGKSSNGSNNTSDPNRFLSTDNIKRAIITNCETESMSFMKTAGNFRGDASKGDKLVIQDCYAKNIQGRNKWSGFVKANFLQIADVYNGLPTDIGFIRIENKYGKTHVEDNINIYNARGLVNMPIWIHDVLVEGAFYDITREFNSSKAKLDYTGGGIITDGDGDYSKAPAYILVEDVLLVGVGNYGLGMAAGHHITMRNSTVLVAGVTDTGKRYEEIGNNVSGIWANPQRSTQGVMDNNLFDNITIGTLWHGKNNLNVSVMKGAVQKNIKHLPTVTKADEQKAIQAWEQRYSNRKIGKL